ncbi:glycosyltransferase [Heliobacterium undosum]|uniref:Glycosyltransferase n=1 Tax=Heliomicrobium undosum TaxID=121734 RepID=A0A845L2N4_9FIRM|nr:glycosyltransferase family 4 protein [Heliomicrobium undosum]MZP28780.1 glycosyltransferase [Heliomicrobium undosum]
MAVIRLCIVSSHPIQYLAPLWRALNDHPQLEVEVFYASKGGASEAVFDKGFNMPVQWDVDLLSGYRHHFLKNRPLTWLNWRFRYRCPDVKEAIRRGGFDALLLLGKEFKVYLDAFDAAVGAGIPVIYRADTPPQKSGVKRWIADRHRYSFYRNIAAFGCVGVTQYGYYEAYGIPRERLFWTPYCVDNRFFTLPDPRAGREQIRAQMGFSPSQRILVFCGKLIPLKRLGDLLQAFSRLPDREQYGVLVIGDGPLRSECEEMVHRERLEGVRFAGFKNQSDLPALYAAGDCLVLPSSSETWGLVVNEAMNLGLPIIASDGVGCAPDLVRLGENGYVYPVGDWQALAARIHELFVDDARRFAMEERSRRIVAGYSLEANVQGIWSALQFALHRKGEGDGG